MQPMITTRLEAKSSSGAQEAQRSQAKAPTRIFIMTTNEAQANTNTVISIMVVFGYLTRVRFDSGSSRSFVSTSFALHAN